MTRYVGQAIKRKEDPRLVSGTSSYVDDIVLPGALHLALVSSIHAHARIKSIDISRAQKVRGVHSVITGKETAANCGAVPAIGDFPDIKRPTHHLLAVDKVKFVGEPVVAVLASDKYVARDAAEMVEIDYDPLPAVTNPEKAIEAGSTVVHDEFQDNRAYTFGWANGDIDGAFRDADVVVKERFINQRLAPVAMETRGVAASLQMPDNELVIWSSTQIPHLLKTQLALLVGVPENRMRVIAPEVGGGFGSKLNVYAEEGLVAYLAKKTVLPVKWIESRRENLAATIHGRDQINDVELALKKDGSILGM